MDMKGGRTRVLKSFGDPGTRVRTYPIILAHGIARFDALWRWALRDPDAGWAHYFRNVRGCLREAGFDARHASVGWADSLAERSRSLRRQVDTALKGTDKVHIVAHSMGGLDARRMLLDGRGDGLHERVASLTTLGTPHRGSPAADLVIRRLPWLLRVGEGVRDLTTAACAAFNAESEDFENSCGVRMRAWAGAQPLRRIMWPLVPAWLVVRAVEGPNDGLVSVQSAMWSEGRFAGTVDADHFNLCGWWDPAERAGREETEARLKGLYLGIAEELGREFPVRS